MKLTLDELVSLTGGKLIRSLSKTDNSENTDREISGLAALDDAGPEDVSFLGNEKYYQDFLKTSAAVVLIPAEVPEYPPNAALIAVENPSAAFSIVVKHFVQKQRKFTPGIHPSAHVAEDVEIDASRVCVKAGAVIELGASIGNGSEIGCGSVVGVGVSMGEDCQLHANVTIYDGCKIGSRVIFHSGCVIGSDGYGYEVIDGRHEKVDQVGIVQIEDDVEIGANSTVDRARFGKTIIGQGTKVDNLVQIAHNVTIGKHCLVVAQTGIAGSSHLGNYVTMAAKSGCGGHVNIGDKAVVTAKSAAMKDVKGGVVYMGMPARPMREQLKKMASVARLPKLLTEVKELRRRLDEIESA
jgi:UDP-3-O-[3-hydroxymyristoyl] glucosamine N-acyltransferase